MFWFGFGSVRVIVFVIVRVFRCGFLRVWFVVACLCVCVCGVLLCDVVCR